MRRTGILTAGICLALLLCGRSAAAASLTLAWDPEVGKNVAGYMVAYGTQSGVYTTTIQAGNQTSQQVNGLADGTTYYFVVHTYSSLGTMSPASAEVWGQTPRLPAFPRTSNARCRRRRRLMETPSPSISRRAAAVARRRCRRPARPLPARSSRSVARLQRARSSTRRS